MPPLPYCGYLGSPLGTNVWDGWGVSVLFTDGTIPVQLERRGSTHLSSEPPWGREGALPLSPGDGT